MEVTGYFDDFRSYVEQAGCFIVPLRVRLTGLDAWARGKAVVSTEIDSEGLDAEGRENARFRNSPQEFGDGVLHTLRDPTLRDRLGRSARATAQRRCDWKIIGRDLRDSYLELIASSTT